MMIRKWIAASAMGVLLGCGASQESAQTKDFLSRSYMFWLEGDQVHRGVCAPGKFDRFYCQTSMEKVNWYRFKDRYVKQTWGSDIQVELGQLQTRIAQVNVLANAHQSNAVLKRQLEELTANRARLQRDLAAQGREVRILEGLLRSPVPTVQDHNDHHDATVLADSRFSERDIRIAFASALNYQVPFMKEATIIDNFKDAGEISFVLNPQGNLPLGGVVLFSEGQRYGHIDGDYYPVPAGQKACRIKSYSRGPQWASTALHVKVEQARDHTWSRLTASPTESSHVDLYPENMNITCGYARDNSTNVDPGQGPEAFTIGDLKRAFGTYMSQLTYRYGKIDLDPTSSGRDYRHSYFPAQ